MRKRPESSVTTILANRVGRSSVSAMTQTPASAVRPLVTTPRMLCALAVPSVNNDSNKSRRVAIAGGGGRGQRPRFADRQVHRGGGEAERDIGPPHPVVAAGAGGHPPRLNAQTHPAR